MFFKNKYTSFCLCIGLVLLNWVLGSLSAQASIKIEFHDSVLDLQAADAPLAEVLSAISEKTGIRITSAGPLTESVTINMKGTPVEEALSRLLGGRNYFIAFDEKQAGRPLPSAVWVLGGGNTRSGRFTRQGPASSPAPPPPRDPMQRLEKGWFEKEFGNRENLLSGISAEPGPNRPSTPRAAHTPNALGESAVGLTESEGIRISKISNESVFAKMGLEQGDTVHDINGKPVKSVEEFIDAFENSLKSEGHARVARTRSSTNELDPIYLSIR